MIYAYGFAHQACSLLCGSIKGILFLIPIAIFNQIKIGLYLHIYILVFCKCEVHVRHDKQEYHPTFPYLKFLDLHLYNKLH